MSALWLIELAGKNERLNDLAGKKFLSVLNRRQDLPATAFISVGQLKQLYGKGNPDGVLPIITISFCWDTAAHPDPRGLQLQLVAATLKREMGKYKTKGVKFQGFGDMGVFWDWATLAQKDPKKWAPCCGGSTYVPPEERTAPQQAAAEAYEGSLEG